jgi:hypothetical protein
MPELNHRMTFRARTGEDTVFLVAKIPEGGFISSTDLPLFVGDIVIAGLSLARVTRVAGYDDEHQTFELAHLASYFGNPR